jgi:predicted nucleotidyltransferase component of viral defense system
MVSEAEIRRQAASSGVDPMVIDLDYSLGWFLAGLLQSRAIVGKLVFKGGTCLRKCYFGDYRFSEDLDFTAMKLIRPEDVLEAIHAVAVWAGGKAGPDFEAAPAKLEIVNDEYGSEAFQVRLYYRGPLKWEGSPRSIRLDISRQEKVLLPPVRRALMHPYTDSDLLQSAAWNCYSLEEVLAEKLRAVGGQRRFIISRDVYDIHSLLQVGVSVEQAIRLLPEKLKIRGMKVADLDPGRLADRKTEFKLDWDRRLGYLVKPPQKVVFEEAWANAVICLRQAQESLTSK